MRGCHGLMSFDILGPHDSPSLYLSLFQYSHRCCTRLATDEFATSRPFGSRRGTHYELVLVPRTSSTTSRTAMMMESGDCVMPWSASTITCRPCVDKRA